MKHDALTLATQSVVLGPTAPAVSGTGVEMQNLRSHPNLPTQNLHLHMIPAQESGRSTVEPHRAGARAVLSQVPLQRELHSLEHFQNALFYKIWLYQETNSIDSVEEVKPKGSFIISESIANPSSHLGLLCLTSLCKMSVIQVCQWRWEYLDTECSFLQNTCFENHPSV